MGHTYLAFYFLWKLEILSCAAILMSMERPNLDRSKPGFCVASVPLGHISTESLCLCSHLKEWRTEDGTGEQKSKVLGQHCQKTAGSDVVVLAPKDAGHFIPISYPPEVNEHTVLDSDKLCSECTAT